MEKYDEDVGVLTSETANIINLLTGYSVNSSSKGFCPSLNLLFRLKRVNAVRHHHHLQMYLKKKNKQNNMCCCVSMFTCGAPP